MPYSHAEWKTKWLTASLKICWIKCVSNTLKRPGPQSSLSQENYFGHHVLCCFTGWGGSCCPKLGSDSTGRWEMLCQSAILAWQLRSHCKGAANCQMEMIHLFLDCCLIYSATVQNKPAPFLLSPSCAWKVRWKCTTVLDSVSSHEWMRLFPHHCKAQLSFLDSLMGSPTGLKCLLAWAIRLPFTNMSISCLNCEFHTLSSS